MPRFDLAVRNGTIGRGIDDDLTRVDPELVVAVSAKRLLSAQHHTTFGWYRLRGWPMGTIRDRRILLANCDVVGVPDCVYLKRPNARHRPTPSHSEARVGS